MKEGLQLHHLWWVAVLIMTNALSFALMGIDKARAKRKAWRISERTLMVAAGCFGSLGGMLGMLAFRHKTQHVKFAVGFPLMLVAHIAAILLLLNASGLIG